MPKISPDSPGFTGLDVLVGKGDHRNLTEPSTDSLDTEPWVSLKPAGKDTDVQMRWLDHLPTEKPQAPRDALRISSLSFKVSRHYREEDPS